MAVPKSRHTKSKRNRRRSHISLKAPVLISCSKCGTPVLPHTLCANCGYYKGREVVNVLEKLEAKEKKKREKDMKAKEKEGIKDTQALSAKELSRK